MTPLTGEWGTSVTITGENFGGTGGDDEVEFTGSGGAGANGFVVDTWSDSQVVGRVAFPATGEVEVQNAGGATVAGTFTTTMPWLPAGPTDDVDEFDGVVLSTGTLAVLDHEYELIDDVALAVYSGSGTAAYELADLVGSSSDPTVPIAARVVEADDQTPEVIATDVDGNVDAYTITGGLMMVSTGLTGTLLATTRDAQGIYAWIATGSGVERVRPAATPPWTVDLGPFASTQPPVDAAIGSDGTLWVVVSEADGSGASYVSIEQLAPAGSAFSALERADPTSYPGTISRAHIIVGDDGIHALVEATADSSGTLTPLMPDLRTAVATWSAAPAVTGLVQYAFLGSTLAAVTNDSGAKTTSLQTDATMPSTAQIVPVWPMQSDGIVVDSSGAPHLLVTNGDVSYAVAQAP
jgi:hypothetical protein